MGIIITAFVYLISVTILILIRVKAVSRGRVFFKCLSSILFIVLWLISIACEEPTLFDFMVLASLVFYMTGDIILVIFRLKRGFVAGMAAFMTGNLILVSGLVLKTGIGAIDFIVLIIMILIAAVGLGFRHLDFGRNRIFIVLYIFITCIMVTKAITVIRVQDSMNIFVAVLFAFGAFLYGVSDIVLANNKFKYHDSRWLSPLNLGLYYSGIGLIAVFSTMLV